MSPNAAVLSYLVALAALSWSLSSTDAVAVTKNVDTSLPFPCQIVEDTGPCRAAKEFFFYNTTSNMCESFRYGGCDGTANRFRTKEHCTEYCRPGVCSLSPCTESCPNGFAVDSNGCRTCSCLEPGGSILAPTLLSSRPECRPLRKCPSIFCPHGFALDADGCHTCECASPVREVKFSLTTVRLPCLMDVDRGPCRAAKEYFFFNATSERCETFLYGGCEGSETFLYGGCEGSETFLYGGCEGSANRFATVEHCTKYCQADACSAMTCQMHCADGFAVDSNGCQICSCLEHGRSLPAPTLPGECPLRQCPDIYCPDGYEKDSDGCHTCACASPVLETRSPATSVLTTRRLPCLLEVDQGPCMASKTRYFYNLTANRCESFIYGGCKGSANRFSTVEHCTEYCRSDACSAMTCLMHCADGFAVDSNGCQICSCLEHGRSLPAPTLPGECPLRKCPGIYCPDGYEKDSDGCHTCACASPVLETPSPSNTSSSTSSNTLSTTSNATSHGCPSSKTVTCFMYCEHGFKVDEQGCQLCECSEQPVCRDKEVSCQMFCEHGMKTDDQGCTLCECNQAPVCADISLTCQKNCKHGYVVDHSGCSTCECRPVDVDVTSSSCRQIDGSCQAFCLYSPVSSSSCSICRCRMPPLTEALCDGHVVSECVRDGCPHQRGDSHRHHDNTCEHCQCETDPCQSLECDEDQKCVVEYNTMTAKCVGGKRWCPEMTCRKYCENGFLADEDGCETCSCRREGPRRSECPRRELLSAATCEFGPRYDQDGCQADGCLPNPCNGDKNRCANDTVCEAYRIKNCSYCPAMARCIDVSFVQWAKISVVYSVSSERIDRLAVTELAGDRIVQGIETSNHCSMRQLSARMTSSARQFSVEFHLTPSSFECDPVLTAKKLVSKIEHREVDVNVFWNGVTLQLSSIQVTYHSDDYVIHDVITITFIEQLLQQPSVVSAVILSTVVGVMVMAAMIVLVCRRRQRKRPKTGYKKSNESDFMPSLM